MSIYISNSIRRLVAARADHRCEYCKIYDMDAYFPFHIDHIISMKHGGETAENNLAYTCQICNLNKGTDIFTFLHNPDESVRFFNPRKDIWAAHFEVDFSGEIIPKTSIGAATLKIFHLNHPESIIERREMIRLGIF